MLKLHHSTGTGTHSLAARGFDSYPTAPEPVEALLRVERFPERVWEPACGRYVTDPHTHVRCLGFATDNEPAKTLIPHKEPNPPKLIAAARDPDCIFAAHSAGFEAAVYRHILAARFGLPEIPLERWRCTQAMAQALALPPALENLARELDLKHQKDMAGARVMAALSKPRKQKVSAGEDLGGTYYNDDSIPSASPLGKQAMRISRGI